MPADPSTYCPACGFQWQVRGCAPGRCETDLDVLRAFEAEGERERRRMAEREAFAVELAQHALKVAREMIDD